MWETKCGRIKSGKNLGQETANGTKKEQAPNT